MINFETWSDILLEATTRRLVHYGHKGVDMVGNNTHTGCVWKQCSIGSKVPKVCLACAVTCIIIWDFYIVKMYSGIFSVTVSDILRPVCLAPTTTFVFLSHSVTCFWPAADHLDHMYMPKCNELQVCDWLISYLLQQAVECVYLMKWPVIADKENKTWRRRLRFGITPVLIQVLYQMLTHLHGNYSM